MADRKEFYNDDSSMGAFQYKLPFYETMELFIETLTGTCFELRVSPCEPVVSVKAKIQRLEGIPVSQQHLIWNNMELDDEYCLHDYSIAEGCTLKLVLAMRGGPINTRRVAVEDPLKEVADVMERWQRDLPTKQVTFLVYREGDQLNVFRVVERGDGTLRPLSGALSMHGSVCHVFPEEGGEEQQTLENCVTMSKMQLLRAKMEDVNLNKKPNKSAKLKPRPSARPHPCSLGPPASPHPCSLGPPASPHPCSLGPPASPHPCAPPGARHHRRSLRVLPQIDRHSTTRPPPLRDHGAAPPPALSSARLSVAGRAPPTSSSSSSSSSCYMLQEEEPWESCPPFAKLRPPPKVSRLDVGSGRLMRDCVYPQLPPLSTRGQAAEALGLCQEATGPVEPAQDLLSLDVCGQPEGVLEVGAEHWVPAPSSLLSTWALGSTAKLTGPDRTRLGDTVPNLPPSMPPCPPCHPARRSPQPLEFTGSRLRPGPPPARPSSLLQPGNAPPRPASSPPPPPRPPRLRGIKVDAPGKRPEMPSERLASLASLSSRAAGGNREGLGQSLGLGLALPTAGASGQGARGSMPPSIPTNTQLLQDDLMHRAAVSYMASNRAAAGASTSIRRLGTPASHLPPVKAATGAKKKSSKHCLLCGRKTGLATSYQCRCGNNFCATHRYAETHDCTYDYKTAGRHVLQETHPIVSAPKLPKI